MWTDYFILIILCATAMVESQQMSTFILDCNDHEIISHVANNNHSYCHHACGNIGPNTSSKCSPEGHCECSCVEAVQLEDLCNVTLSQPDDLALHQSCDMKCSKMCDGGSGYLCSETKVFPLNVYVRICTCSCHREICNGSTSIISTSSAPTTTLITTTVKTTELATPTTTTTTKLTTRPTTLLTTQVSTTKTPIPTIIKPLTLPEILNYRSFADILFKLLGLPETMKERMFWIIQFLNLHTISWLAKIFVHQILLTFLYLLLGIYIE